mgnify:CR=1 FL=1
MQTNDERRAVAARLRGLRGFEVDGKKFCSCYDVEDALGLEGSIMCSRTAVRRATIRKSGSTHSHAALAGFVKERSSSTRLPTHPERSSPTGTTAPIAARRCRNDIYRIRAARKESQGMRD